MPVVWGSPDLIAERARVAVDDETLKRNLNHAAEHERAARRAMEAELDWPAMREQARRYREDAIEHLPELLDQLERNVRASGGEVFRARTSADATGYVTDVIKARKARLVVKGKSMMSEEIGLNDALCQEGIEVVETDLGEYIVQQRGDRPSHILAPAVHLNAGQVARLFSRLGGKPLAPDDTTALVDYARGVLRERFLEADVGLSGANFAVAESGTLIVVESEGNIRMTTAFPRCHVVVMGIEKVLRDWRAAAHLVQMLPLAAHGTRMAANSSFITGPAREGDDGPAELHLVLIDNGRLELAGSEYREALHCIRCAACLAACPVYRQVGGHTYGSFYNGPIGAVISPLLAGAEQAGQLAELSSLCGACREVCPVDIPLDDHLVMLRRDHRREKPRTAERLMFKAWGKLWSRPAGYRATTVGGSRVAFPLLSRLRPSRKAASQRKAERVGGGAIRSDRVAAQSRSDRRWIARVPPPLSGWTKGRDFKTMAREPFHRRWIRHRWWAYGDGLPSQRDTESRDRRGRVDADQEEFGRKAPADHEIATDLTDIEAFADLVDLFGLRLDALGVKLSVAQSEDQALELIAGAAGKESWTAWRDPLLDRLDLPGPCTESGAAELSIVRADVAVAETGTIGFAHGTGRPRAAALLPQAQIAVVAAFDLVATVGDALKRFFSPNQPDCTPASNHPGGAPGKNQPDRAQAGNHSDSMLGKSLPDASPARRHLYSALAESQLGGAPLKSQLGGAPLKSQLGGAPLKSQLGGAPLKSQQDNLPGNVVFVTGPSRTADIELRPIIGVHSPKRLDVILVFTEDG